mgnify:CR=1 FL=1
MNETMRPIIGKTVASIQESACNVKRIFFTDETFLEIETVLVLPTPNLYGIETHIRSCPPPRDAGEPTDEKARKSKPVGNK